jgi:hypothetical protein
MIDLRYLNGYNGTLVKATIKLDPRYSPKGESEEVFYGMLTTGCGPLWAELLLGVGEVRGSQIIETFRLGYLCDRQTLWSIKTENSQMLLDHKNLDGDRYDVLGPEGNRIGRVHLKIPYQTPYGDIMNLDKDYPLLLFGELEFDLEKVAESYFKKWREQQLDLF